MRVRTFIGIDNLTNTAICSSLYELYVEFTVLVDAACEPPNFLNDQGSRAPKGELSQSFLTLLHVPHELILAFQFHVRFSISNE